MKKILAVGIVVSVLWITGCYYGPCINGDGPLMTEARSITGFTGVSHSADFDVYVTQADTFSVEVIAPENLLPIIETYLTGYTLVVGVKNNSCYKSSVPVQLYISLPELEILELNGSGRLMADIAESQVFECMNNGSGYVGIDTIAALTLTLANSGSGSVDVKRIYGREIDLIQSGSGSISGGEILESEGISIRHSSSGAIGAVVDSGSKLDAILSGSGRIDLAGDVAEVDYTLNSSGRIDALDLMASDARTTSSGSGNIFVWATDLLEVTITGSGDIIYRGNPSLSFRMITGSGSVRPY